MISSARQLVEVKLNTKREISYKSKEMHANGNEDGCGACWLALADGNGSI